MGDDSICVGFLINSTAHARNRERWSTHLCSLGAEMLHFPTEKRSRAHPPALPLTKGLTPRNAHSPGTRPVHTGSLGCSARPPACGKTGLPLAILSVPLHLHCCHLGGRAQVGDPSMHTHCTAGSHRLSAAHHHCHPTGLTAFTLLHVSMPGPYLKPSSHFPWLLQ